MEFEITQREYDVDRSTNGKCRCCLVQGRHQHYFGKVELEMLNENLNLNLMVKPGLPQLLCSQCLASLIEVQKFRWMVMATETELRLALSREVKLESMIPRNTGQQVSDTQLQKDPLEIDHVKRESNFEDSWSGSSTTDDLPDEDDIKSVKMELGVSEVTSKDSKSLVKMKEESVSAFSDANTEEEALKPQKTRSLAKKSKVLHSAALSSKKLQLTANKSKRLHMATLKSKRLLSASQDSNKSSATSQFSNILNSNSECNKGLKPASKRRKVSNLVPQNSKELNSTSDSSKRLQSAAQTSKRLYSTAQTSKGLQSTTKTSKRLHSTAETSKRLHSTAQTSERLHSTAPTCKRLHSTAETNERLQSVKDLQSTPHTTEGLDLVSRIIKELHLVPQRSKRLIPLNSKRLHMLQNKKIRLIPINSKDLQLAQKNNKGLRLIPIQSKGLQLATKSNDLLSLVTDIESKTKDGEDIIQNDGKLKVNNSNTETTNKNNIDGSEESDTEEEVIDNDIEIKTKDDDDTMPNNKKRKINNSNSVITSKNKCDGSVQSDAEEEVIDNESRQAAISRMLAIAETDRHLLLVDNNKVRSNIILILQHSTIIPFRNKFKLTFKCFYCDKLYIPFKELKEHIETKHHSVSVSTITKIIRSMQDLIVTADISCIKCRLCEEKFDSIENLIQHLCNVHEKVYHETDRKPSHGILGVDLSTDKLKCHICNQEQTFFKNLLVHMNEHYGGFVCYVCGKKFLSERRYKSHVISTHENKPISCKQCNKIFKTEATMKCHVKKVHLKTRLKCLYCPVTFTSGNYVQRWNHMAEVHGVKKPIYKCDMCGKELANSASLGHHKMYTHRQAKVHTCELCGYSTCDNSSMKKHMVIHTGEKKFECEFCKKRFAKSDTLKLHMKIHLNIKKFVCVLCDAAFIQKNSLKNHFQSRHPDSGVDINNFKTFAT